MPILPLTGRRRWTAAAGLGAAGLCLLTVSPSGAQTADAEWSAFTSMKQVRGLLLETFNVWAATTGGVLRYDRLQRRYQRFTRLDGLAGNRILSLAVDADGNMWFGSDGQGLSRYRPATGTFDPPFLEFRDLAITSLLPHGRVLYVGTSDGVSAFLIDREEVKESYHLMGNLPKDAAAVGMSLLDDVLFVGTPDGVAWAHLEQPNLQDPDSWRSQSDTGPVRAIVRAGGLMHVGSRHGVFTYRPSDDRFSQDLPGAVTALGARGGRAVAALEDSNLMLRTGNQTWERIPGPPVFEVNVLSDSGVDFVWIGTEQGLRVVGNLSSPPPSGEPGSSRFYEIAVVGEEELWAASVPDDQQRSLSAGAYHLADGSWQVYDRDRGMPNDELVALETDGDGRVWIGSWGGGVLVREADGTFTEIPTESTALQGIPNAPGFVVVSDIQRDRMGNMWMVNVLVGVAVLDAFPPQQQFLFEQARLGLSPNVDFYRMAIDADGLKWIASRTDGLVLLDDGGTPFTGGDDRFLVLGPATESRMTSSRVFDVHASSDGKVWMATDSGINVLTPDYDRATGTLTRAGWRVYNTFDGLPSADISTFAEDDGGNIWVGTDAGLSRIGRSGEVDLTFTRSNSGLIDNRVKGLTFDRERGELWIGTFDGLSRLRLTTTVDGNDPETLTVYPNPFVTDGRDRLTFVGMPLGAALRIYTVAGELVASLQGAPGRGTVVWNGQNDDGFLVASGIYLYVAEGEAGDAVSGRFAVVNGVRR